MNFAPVTSAHDVVPAGADDLVIEDLSQYADEYQPGTCICWVDEPLSA